MSIEKICPYCQNELTRPPKKRGRCPHCNQMVFFKLARGEKEKKLVTCAHAMQIDMAWRNWDMATHRPPDEFDLQAEVILKLEHPEPERPLITLSGDEILNEIKDK